METVFVKNTLRKCQSQEGEIRRLLPQQLQFWSWKEASYSNTDGWQQAKLKAVKIDRRQININNGFLAAVNFSKEWIENLKKNENGDEPVYIAYWQSIAFQILIIMEFRHNYLKLRSGKEKEED